MNERAVMALSFLYHDFFIVRTHGSCVRNRTKIFVVYGWTKLEADARAVVPTYKGCSANKIEGLENNIQF